jgi:hypothetical protein
LTGDISLLPMLAGSMPHSFMRKSWREALSTSRLSFAAEKRSDYMLINLALGIRVVLSVLFP